VGLAIVIVAAATLTRLNSSDVLSQLPKLEEAQEAEDVPGLLREEAKPAPFLNASDILALTVRVAGNSAASSVYNTERHIVKAAPGTLHHVQLYRVKSIVTAARLPAPHLLE